VRDALATLQATDEDARFYTKITTSAVTDYVGINIISIQERE